MPSHHIPWSRHVLRRQTWMCQTQCTSSRDPKGRRESTLAPHRIAIAGLVLAHTRKSALCYTIKVPCQRVQDPSSLRDQTSTADPSGLLQRHKLPSRTLTHKDNNNIRCSMTTGMSWTKAVISAHLHVVILHNRLHLTIVRMTSTSMLNNGPMPCFLREIRNL